MLLIFTETRREGHYYTGDILFTSETNNVNVRFTSDRSWTMRGFSLDVQSISCADRSQYPQYNACDESVHEVQLAEDEVQQGALVTNTQSDGNYPNNACQNWNIIADENQVCDNNNNYYYYFS